MPRAAAVLVLATCLCGVARAERYEQLGRLEREAVDGALASRHLELDPAPEGKHIGAIHVVTRKVFSERDGFLRWFNVFHRTTRETIIAREVLTRPGDLWSDDLNDETLRNLRDVFIHNVVVIVPVKNAAPELVDVLVVTRDVWSLRLNSNFEVQDQKLTFLSFSLSENNFLGLRKKLALSFRMDQGAIAMGPTYTDPNIAGKRLTMQTAWRAIFGRESLAYEGTSSASSFAYPLWSLRSRWGAGIEVSHYDAIDRNFRGTRLRTFDAPETAAVEMLPYEYPRRAIATDTSVVRSFGTSVIQRVSAGHELDLSRPRLSDDFTADPVLRQSFTDHVLTRSELSSALYLRWRLFTPTYMTARDLDTFDLREDYQVGPSIDTKVSAARTELGSEHDFFRLAAAAQWSVPLAGGLGRASTGWSARVEDGDVKDHLVSGRLYLASPIWHCTGRVLAVADFDTLIDETGNRFLTAGGDTGMRGYGIGAFIGQSRLITHVEVRTVPARLWFLRFGAVAFWDMGHAAPEVSAFNMKHDVGAGIRYLIPQIDPFVFRADWAIPLDGPTKGFPGRLTLGVFQVF